MKRYLRVVAVAALLGAPGCILVDAPPELPTFPSTRPFIVTSSVVPPATEVLTGPYPLTFTVPVEVVDPSSAFEWSVFVDFDPSNRGAGAYLSARDELKAGEMGVRVVSFTLTEPLDPMRCHVVEFIVARSFAPQSRHTPEVPGGDSVSWFVNPTGDLGACPTFDAGGLGSPPLQASEGGT